MAKYVHLFETQADFTAAYNGSEYQEPWVSYTIQNEEVDYNKENMSQTEIITEPGGHIDF